MRSSRGGSAASANIKAELGERHDVARKLPEVIL